MIAQKLFSVLLAAGLAFGVQNVEAQQANNGAAGQPQISFEKTTHDFGKIPQGENASYSFKFTNNGDAPLVLKNVKPSCGCTTPHWPKEPIKPGETAKIKAVYDAGSPGRFHKSITVKTNMKNNGTKVLSIKGRVQK